MQNLLITGVRCFRDEQVAPIRPITLLIGDNSSGKSTFLSMIRVADALQHGHPIQFNEPPFLMGTFDQIAHFHGGQGKREKRFVVGVDVETSRRAHRSATTSTARIQGVFDSADSEPRLSEWSFAADDIRMKIRSTGANAISLLVHSKGSDYRLDLRVGTVPRPLGWVLAWHYLVDTSGVEGDGPKWTPEIPPSVIESIRMNIMSLSQWGVGPGLTSIAPIRSTPSRTYDPVRDLPTPEGGHIPLVLARLAAAGGPRWESLRDAIGRFGLESGLMRELKVVRKGQKRSDPFQVFVGVGRYPFNLVDVGYGVSQVLPILVDVLLAPPRHTFLLQQPEVHLHPRAQAAVGTFVVEQSTKHNKRFVIETHSDYLVDRVRMAVRSGQIPSSEVALLYFHRVEEHVEILTLTLNSDGEIANPPDGYREFFLREQEKLLGL